MRSFGTEEEFLLVNPLTGEPVAASETILEADRESRHTGVRLTDEMQQEMIEAVTAPHLTLALLRRDIDRARAVAESAARAAGVLAVPLASSPLPVQPHPSEGERYQTMVKRYGITARRSLTCGLHIHVSVESPDEGVGVLDRIRDWLPVLVAMSANSPFSDGQDTGHASFRSSAWRQWPSAGPTDTFGSIGAYRSFENQLMSTGALIDSGMLYLDARLSRNYPTIEIRVADVCLRPSTSAALAAIARALVEQAAQEWRNNVEPLRTPTGVLRLASWRAALTGVSGDLVDPVRGEPRSAHAVVTSLLDRIDAPLRESGDWGDVHAEIHTLLAEGTGADWQRTVFRASGQLSAILSRAAEEMSGRDRAVADRAAAVTPVAS